MSVFKGIHCANKPDRGGKAPLAVEAAAWKSLHWEGGMSAPLGPNKALLFPTHLRQTENPEPPYRQPCSVTLPDNSEQKPGLAVKQGEWLLPCSAQESIF